MSSFTPKFSCSSKVSKKGHLKQNNREKESWGNGWKLASLSLVSLALLYLGRKEER